MVWLIRKRIVMKVRSVFVVLCMVFLSERLISRLLFVNQSMGLIFLFINIDFV